MPELPEVETVRRGLAPFLEGERIHAVDVQRPDLRFPFPDGLAEAIRGRTISAVNRRAKYLLLELDDGSTLLCHLGMSGVWTTVAPEDITPQIGQGKHDHFVLHREDGGMAVYSDPRRFGFILHFFSEHPMLDTLGPEPSELTTAALLERLKGRRTPMKAALLDQKVVAGLGNIYVSEILHRAGVSPRRQARTIGPKRADRIVESTQRVIADAIAAGGSTLSDGQFTGVGGELGYFPHEFRVYAREGEACRDCAGTIRRIVQSGRSTFYCPKCQR